jgi:hypothetical protein
MKANWNIIAIYCGIVAVIFGVLSIVLQNVLNAFVGAGFATLTVVSIFIQVYLINKNQKGI